MIYLIYLLEVIISTVVVLRLHWGHFIFQDTESLKQSIIGYPATDFQPSRWLYL